MSIYRADELITPLIHTTVVLISGVICKTVVWIACPIGMMVPSKFSVVNVYYIKYSSLKNLGFKTVLAHMQ